MEALVEEIVCADYSESMKKRFETCSEMFLFKIIMIIVKVFVKLTKNR